MKKELKMTKKIVLTLLGIIFSISLICNYTNQTSAQEISKNKEATLTYDIVYSEVLNVSGKNVPIKVLLNPNVITDGKIQIGNQSIPIDTELAKNVGYAHAKATAYDFTGDGKKEIALVISGGASGSIQAIQIFENANQSWNEISIPAEIYKDMPSFVKQNLKKLNIKAHKNMVYYRTVSFNKEKILITYHFFSNSTNKEIGKVCKQLTYSSAKKEFVLGDTSVIRTTNKKCVIKASANKSAITVKWRIGVKKSSIKGVQIKVATKSNMKGAKTYKFGKKTAQKMLYKFTKNSGKIVKNKKYYFKVRLKVEKNGLSGVMLHKAKSKNSRNTI